MPQAVLVLSYVFIFCTDPRNGHLLASVIERDEETWEKSFLPQRFHMSESDAWWSTTQELLVKAGSMNAISKMDLQAHLGYLLQMIEDIASLPSNHTFMKWKNKEAIARPCGSKVSLALLCHSFAVPIPQVDLNSLDPWLYDVSFINTMLEDLRRSPLFQNGICLDGLKTVLLSLEAVFSIQDDQSALLQPYPLRIDDPLQLKTYYQTAFKVLDPALLFQVWWRWQSLLNLGNQNQAGSLSSDFPRPSSGTAMYGFSELEQLDIGK